MSKRIFSSFLFFTFLSFIYVEGNDENIKSVMEIHQVVPDVIDEAPDSELKVIYEGEITVENGIELTPTQVKNPPMVMWVPAPDSFYTLLLISPDAPTRESPTTKELQFWVVVNIPGNDISNGEAITEHMGIGPPLGTGLHRYVFLLYKQPEKMSFDEERIQKTSAKGRRHFSTRKFVEKYNLGMPIAGNIFEAQYDDYVPVVYEQTGWLSES